MIKRLLSSLAIILMCAMAAPAAALATTPFDNVDCATAASSAVCTGKNSSASISGANGVIIRVSQFIAMIAGIIAVVILIIAAIKFVTSGGDPNAVSSARNTIIGAFIGLVVIAASETIIMFVVSKL